MRFLLTPVGSSGDVHPFVGIGRRLRERGHEVVVATAEPFGALVTGAGLEFHPLVPAAEFERITRHPDLWHPRRGMQIVLGEVAARLREGYAAVARLYEPGRTVLVGHSLSFFTRVFEEVHDAPAATIHLAPSIFRSDYEQPAHAPGRDATNWPLWLKRVVWWAVDRFLVDPHVAPSLNAWRRELGLPQVNRPLREWIHSPRRVIALFPDWFARPQPDWPSAVRLAGFPLYDEADQAVVPPALRRFLEEGSPPIVFTPGSANRNAAAFFSAAVDAAQRLGRRALLLSRYDEHLPALPEGIVHHERYVPLSQVLPSCAALVCHAGIGTVAQGLAAGVPQLVMPMGFDQPDNATRLQRLGVGRWLLPGDFSGSQVAATLQSLLDDPQVAARCRAIAALMRGHDATGLACDLLEELMPDVGGDGVASAVNPR